MSKELFATIYSFMGNELKLSGLTKEVFAYIFAMWNYNKRCPVYATIPTLVKFTGAARSSIQLAISNLKNMGYIVPKPTPGKRTMYIVSVPEEILAAYETLHGLKSGLYPPENQNSTRPNKGGHNNYSKNTNIYNVPKLPEDTELSAGELNEI